MCAMRLARAFAAHGYHLGLTLDQRGAAAMPCNERGRPVYCIINEPNPPNEEPDRQKLSRGLFVLRCDQVCLERRGVDVRRILANDPKQPHAVKYGTLPGVRETRAR